MTTSSLRSCKPRWSLKTDGSLVAAPCSPSLSRASRTLFIIGIARGLATPPPFSRRPINLPVASSLSTKQRMRDTVSGQCLNRVMMVEKRLRSWAGRSKKGHWLRNLLRMSRLSSWERSYSTSFKSTVIWSSLYRLRRWMKWSGRKIKLKIKSYPQAPS